MSKSIYEDAFNHLDELVDALAHIEGSFLYRHYLDNIRLKLKQAQKQEKLLNKIKEIIDRQDDSYISSMLEESQRYYEIKQFIKGEGK